MRAKTLFWETKLWEKRGDGFNKGGRPKTGSDEELVSVPTLAEVGIDKKLSSRFGLIIQTDFSPMGGIFGGPKKQLMSTS